MTTNGIDCASSTLGHIPALKQAGMKFACRYVAPTGKDFDWKRLTPPEVAALKSAGLGIVLVFEGGANRARGGRTQGIQDAQIANAAATALGLTGAPIYFAVDYDAPTSDLDEIGQYLTGAASVITHDRTGVYGGLRVVSYALDRKLCRYAWQTRAWSGTPIRWDSRAQLQQYETGSTGAKPIGGLAVDYNHAMAADYGQWHPPKRIVGYTISYIDAKGHRVNVDVQTRTRLGQRQPEHWQRRHHVVHTRGKVVITRRFRVE